MRRIGKIALSAAIFVGWLCFVLLLQSLGTVTQAEQQPSGSASVPVTSTSSSSAVSGVASTVGDDFLPLRESSVPREFISDIEQALRRDSSLPHEVKRLLTNWDVTVKVENIRAETALSVPYYLEGNPRELYRGQLYYDVVLSQDDRELLLFDIPCEVQTSLFAHIYHSNTVFVTESGLLGITSGDSVQLYDETLTPAGAAISFPELRRAYEIIGLSVSEHLGVVAAVRMDNEDYLYLPGDGKAQPVLFPLADFDAFSSNPPDERYARALSSPRFIEGPVLIETYEDRFVVFRCNNIYPGLYVCDLETQSVWALSSIFSVSLGGGRQPYSYLMVAETPILYRGEANDRLLCAVWDNNTLVRCGFMDTPRDDEILRVFSTPQNYDEYADVRVSYESGIPCAIAVADELRCLTFDFNAGTMALSYEPKEPAAVSPSGRYHIYSVYLEAPSSDQSDETEWYLRDTHTDTFMHLTTTYFFDRHIQFGFIDDNTAYSSYDWRSGVALYSTSTGERLDWALATTQTYEDGDPYYGHILCALFDPPNDRFVVLEAGDYPFDTAGDEDINMRNAVPLIIGLYDRSGERYAEIDTGALLHVYDMYGASPPVDVSFDGSAVSFSQRAYIYEYSQWDIIDYRFDLNSGVLEKVGTRSFTYDD